MKKVFLGLMVVCLGALALMGSSKPVPTSHKACDELATILNRELPQKIDPITILQVARCNDNFLHLTNRVKTLEVMPKLKDASTAEKQNAYINLMAIQKGILVEMICKNAGDVSELNKGIVISYDYFDESHMYMGSVEISSQDCKK